MHRKRSTVTLLCKFHVNLLDKFFPNLNFSQLIYSGLCFEWVFAEEFGHFQWKLKLPTLMALFDH